MKSFLQGALKLAFSISLALIAAVAVFVGGFKLFEDYQEKNERKLAAPYEQVVRRSLDLKDHLALEFTVETKLVNGEMYAAVRAQGYPPYLEHPTNRRSGGFSVQFLDRDGFLVYDKSIQLTDFLTNWSAERATGISYQFKEFTGLDLYKRFDAVRIAWTVDPKLVPRTPEPAAPRPTAVSPDPCAPNISKDERLRRLARFGEVRQTSGDAYEAGARRVFFVGDQLISCR